ncbi:metastasis-associated in colon cancer protein 1 [Archocentrus centrarchus]|uniref:metastasis-associated in colon cancer protein 1 n=1 Tax=Archocentrus centrarchus TaxID=63155 RepID=UPI0011EA0A26|nr:metastasis-associated in colon cancer protein 1 [Archocentrus centrarchus]
MAAEKTSAFRRVGSLMRSKSEGTLIDLGDSIPTINNLNGRFVSGEAQNSDWTLLQSEVSLSSQKKNPFWDKISASNPFLEDIVHGSTDNHIFDSSDLKEDHKQHLYASNDDAISTSSDEGNLSNILENRHNVTNRSGKWRSTSHILDDLQRKTPRQENNLKLHGLVLNPDFEWLKNDREAYKMAWLSHRQLTRSCLDLNVMSQRPGWAQTQATNFQVICKVGHAGGSVQLPESGISIHIPEGHVPPGEVQEVTLKAVLDPPPGLNNNYITTVSPLVEVVLSHINTKQCLNLEMKLSGEVKNDDLSQVMTTVYGLVSNKRRGPYLKMNDCYIHKNMMQVTLQDLKTHFFVIAVAEASVLQSPATSVWDYLDRQITIAVYGPRYIHPSFKVVIVVCCHEDVPPKLPFSDICRGNKHLPPVVLQLWGKHSFKPDKLSDLDVEVGMTDSVFKIKTEDQLKEVRLSQLKIGTVLHLPVALSSFYNTEMTHFKLDLKVKDSNSSPVAHFQVPSPPAAPIRSEKRVMRQTEKWIEVAKPMPIAEECHSDLPKFTDSPVDVKWYGVALKSVFRQPRVEYLLEYFKGDTLALLSRDTVKSVGNSKVKEWYVGFLRGRTGLVHCKNIKLITKDQVIDFTGVQVTTEVLLENMTLPFKKFTYMYAAIQTLVTEHITSWRELADALGYRKLPADALIRRHADTEPDKVACVLEKLKEDCHTERGRKFLHELIVALLRMDSVNLVSQLIKNTVILSTAVELGIRWRELAEKLEKLSSAQIASYEAPHRRKGAEVGPQSMWKPAYDFLYSWSLRYGDSSKDLIQDLHLVLDKMKNPATRQWRHLTGVLITVNCLDIFRASAFPKP